MRHDPHPRVSRRQFLAGGMGTLGAALIGLDPRTARAYAAVKLESPGKIAGVVRYPGKAPSPARLKLSGDCAFCRKFDIRAEDLLVSPRGGLANVVLALTGISQGKSPPEAQPVLAEERCTFVPHVQSVMAGSRLLLHNRDPVLNTFHALEQPSGRTLFNIGMPNRDQKLARRIRRPGLVKMLCDVHPWEVAFIVALDHPYHAVSDAQGRFELGGVPAGTHTLTLWHERLGTRTKRVQVRAGASVELDLSY